MSLTITIPKDNGEERIELAFGDLLFILGPNGSGKSRLMAQIKNQHAHIATRVSTHRQNWLDSGEINLTPALRKQVSQSILSFESGNDPVWRDPYGHNKTMACIFDLVNSELASARKICDTLREGDTSKGSEMASMLSPIGRINSIFKACYIQIELALAEDNSIFATRNGSQSFSVAELSDGERNALFIAATVLTVEPKSLILIDEPERHLHRSVTSPMISSIIAERNDCAFIVSTHEVTLPIDHPRARILLMRSCRIENGTALGWDFDVVKDDDIGEPALRSILGSRRRIVFVEGTESGLDARIYSRIFRNASVRAVGTCNDVINQTKAIRGSANLHWVKAVGIIDRDSADQHAVDDRKTPGIHTLPYYSVESLYFHPFILRAVIASLCDPSHHESKFRFALEAAFRYIDSNINVLVSRALEMKVRRFILQSIPSWRDIAEKSSWEIKPIEIDTLRSDVERQIRQAIDTQQFDCLLKICPVKQSGIPSAITKSLGIRPEIYYSKTMILIDADPKLLDFMASLFKDVICDLQEE